MAKKLKKTTRKHKFSQKFVRHVKSNLPCKSKKMKKRSRKASGKSKLSKVRKLMKLAKKRRK